MKWIIYLFMYLMISERLVSRGNVTPAEMSEDSPSNHTSSQAVSHLMIILCYFYACACAHTHI